MIPFEASLVKSDTKIVQKFISLTFCRLFFLSFNMLCALLNSD